VLFTTTINKTFGCAEKRQSETIHLAACGTTRTTIPMGPALSVATHLRRPQATQAHQAPVSYSCNLSLLYFKMMESICLDDPDPEPQADLDCEFVEHGYVGPRTPSTTDDNHHDTETDRAQHYETSDVGTDDEYGGPSPPKRKKGGYDSRIEQILYENPELPILIVDAGKSLESGGKYIVYTIRTGVRASSVCTALMLTLNRTLKFVDDIPSSPHYEMPCRGYTLP
jgi:hypothetical protein